MEWGVLIFVLLMFAGRFGTIRELALYIPALLWLFRALVLRSPGFAWRKPLFLVLALFGMSGILSSLTVSDMASSLAALRKDHLKLLVLFVVVATAFAGEDSLFRLGRVLAVAALGYLIAGGYRVGEDLAARGQIDYESVRYYATIYLYLLPPLFVQVIDSGGQLRPLWAAGCLGMLSLIAVIGVRGVWVSLAGAASLWAFAMRGQLRTVLSLKALTVFATLTVLAILLAFLLFPSQFQLIRGHTFEKLQMSLRLETWGTFLTLSSQRPILGHGIDDEAMSRHYHQAFTRERGAAPAILNPTTPHNQFIKIFYQQGLAGLLLYCALLALTMRALYRSFRAGPPGPVSLLSLAMASVVLAEYAIHCLFEDRSLTPLALLIGVAGAYLSREERA